MSSKVEQNKPIANCVDEDSDSDSGSESKYKKGANPDMMGGLKGKLTGGDSSDDEDECDVPIGGEIAPPKTPSVASGSPSTSSAPGVATKQIASSISGSGTVAPKVDGGNQASSKTIGAEVGTKKAKESSKLSEKVLTATIPIDFVASMNELATNPAKAEFKLTESDLQSLQDVRTERVNGKVESKSVGNLEKVTIHSATVVSSTNGYACSSALVSPQIAGSITVGKNKALAVLAANTSTHYETGVLAHKNHNAKSSLVKQLADLSDERIESYYQVSKFNAEECEVKVDSEIVSAALNPKNPALYAKYSGLSIPKGQLTVKMATADVNTIVKQLTGAVKSLPITNMKTFSATLVRADGRAWNSPEGLVGIIDPKNAAEVKMAMNMSRQFHLQLKIEYSLTE